jgi:hypothetical protein
MRNTLRVSAWILVVFLTLAGVAYAQPPTQHQSLASTAVCTGMILPLAFFPGQEFMMTDVTLSNPLGTPIRVEVGRFLEIEVSLDVRFMVMIAPGATHSQSFTSGIRIEANLHIRCLTSPPTPTPMIVTLSGRLK